MSVFIDIHKKIQRDYIKKNLSKDTQVFDHTQYDIYSTVTDFAKFLGWSTFAPLYTAI